MRLDWRIPFTVVILAVLALLWLLLGLRWAVGCYVAGGVSMLVVACFDPGALSPSPREWLTLPVLWLPAIWSDRVLAWIRR